MSDRQHIQNKVGRNSQPGAFRKKMNPKIFDEEMDNYVSLISKESQTSNISIIVNLEDQGKKGKNS
jgi:hypothetical protein